MITYNHGNFGLKLLFRFNGSAVFKSVTPAVLSTAIGLIMFFPGDFQNNYSCPGSQPEENCLFGHPYVFGAMIAALTFLLAFRVSFAYNRYWEAYSAVHQMHAKWTDVAMEFAAFHLQAACFDDRKPPAYGANPELKSLERERVRQNEYTLQELEERLEEMGVDASMRQRLEQTCCLFGRRPAEPTRSVKKAAPKSINATKPKLPATMTEKKTTTAKGGEVEGLQVTPTGVGLSKIIKTAEDLRGRCAWEAGRPPLFLQEGAHLLSLLSAVACSTLRNDLEEADSPLIPFTPGLPWPHVDPDDYKADTRKDWTASRHRSWQILKYMLGMSRSPAARTLYNAARPFRVVGGVSDREVAMLQAARGPLAKVALCFMWVNEYISREYLSGSLGKVAPPIISRIYQFASDGMLGYNQARKVAYIPFPFPHAQITALFVFVLVGFFPLLMISYVANKALGVVVNFLTVMSFAGLHEVARELENPFLNAPNDVPLNNYQAQFNEALMQMFAGYHPDAYWEVYEKQGDWPPTPTTEAEEENRTARTEGPATAEATAAATTTVAETIKSN